MTRAHVVIWKQGARDGGLDVGLALPIWVLLDDVSGRLRREEGELRAGAAAVSQSWNGLASQVATERTYKRHCVLLLRLC